MKNIKSAFSLKGFLGLVIIVTFAVIVLADVSIPNSFNFNQSVSAVYNITLNNTGSSGIDIVEVNITLPSNFSYTASSSGIGSTNSSTFVNTSTVLSWRNNSAGAYLVPRTGLAYVWFNATASWPNNYNISVTVVYTNGSDILPGINQTNVSVIINDTIKPVITVTSPSNITYAASNVTINFTSTDAAGVSARWFYNGTANITYSAVTSVNLSDGQYTLIFYSNDSSNNRNSTSKTFIVDRAPPVVYDANISSPLNYGNYSIEIGNVVLNVTVSDVTAGVDSVFFNITNGSGTENAIVQGTSEGSGRYSATISTSNYTDGEYNVSVFANDSAGNLNNTAKVINIRTDNTAPVVTFSCDRTTLRTGEVVTCSCSATDAVSGVNSTVFTEKPSTAAAGSYSTSCVVNDYSRNYANVSVSYSVTGGGSSSGGGGSSQTWTNNNAYDSKELNEQPALTSTLGSKNKVTVKIGGASHYVGVKSVGVTSAVIEIASTPTEYTFNVGESKKFDVSLDGYYDLLVTLNGIVSGKANVTISSINEKVESAPATTPKTETTGSSGSPVATVANAVKSGGSSVTGWIVGVVIVVLVVYLLSSKKKRK